MPASEIAYAKINLALHVRSRREDGYHALETLFAFVDNGDRLTSRPSEIDRLDVLGEFATGLGVGGNLVARALNALPRAGGWHVTLEKNLPVAAGLGGGSADAGAVFRMVRDSHGLPEGWQDKAARLGADVPACVESRACIGRGTGTELEAVENDLAGTAVLLVNPRVPLSTGEVFRAWDGSDRGALPHGNLRTIAEEGRNDLEDPAIGLVPEIAEVLDALNGTDAWLSRMSGSGATCFALYDDAGARDRAAARIASFRSQWWQMSGALR